MCFICCGFYTFANNFYRPTFVLNMNKAQLINQLNAIDSQINRPRLLRVLSKLPRHLRWSLTKLGLGKTLKSTFTFFGSQLYFPYPASKDIFIWRAKSHDSEIRLAKYVIHTLEEGDGFIDIGAHIGYFSQLAAQLVGNSGCVYALEASPETYKYLKVNTEDLPQVIAYNKAVANTLGTMVFQEYDTAFSEFNSLIEEAPIKNLKSTEVEVETTTLDSMDFKRRIRLIKIDVEGAEDLVIQGMQKMLDSSEPPILVIEFLKDPIKNTAHKKAMRLLKARGFNVFQIDDAGHLLPLEDVEKYIASIPFESDNIIFKKSTSS
ncbi:MAG: FkbM family methyltransferase [Saprospiraceae bacterium]|nr:FkbM family methyltransferase [Saprospiraceae bacterium]